ncbi:hypothetical protein VIGAN_08065500, partial [Vigna angularis var. angularis]
PVHVDVFALSKVSFAVKANTQKASRVIIGVMRKTPIFLNRAPKFEAATLDDAIIKYVSGSRVWPVGNHTSVILREFHFAGRETSHKNPLRISTPGCRFSHTQTPRGKISLLCYEFG